METAFYTTHGKLVLKKDWINEFQVVEQQESYWLHSFLLLCLMAIYSIDEIREGRYTKWGALAFALILAVPHLKRIYSILFVHVWRRNFRLKEVRKVELNDRFNELEEKVIITLHSGRKKVYLFRKKELQARPFAEAVTAAVSLPLLGPAS